MDPWLVISALVGALVAVIGGILGIRAAFRDHRRQVSRLQINENLDKILCDPKIRDALVENIQRNNALLERLKK